MIDYYKQGYEARTKGVCRELSICTSKQLQDYSLGWLQAWKDEGYKKTTKGRMPVKQAVL